MDNLGIGSLTSYLKYSKNDAHLKKRVLMSIKYGDNVKAYILNHANAKSPKYIGFYTLFYKQHIRIQFGWSFSMNH